MDQTKQVPIPGWSTEISEVGFHKIEIRGYALGEIIKHLTFSEVIYLTIRGELPSRNHARVFDAVLCGIVDHGFFAPTGIAARIVASANADNIIPGVAAGILTVGSVTVSPGTTAELIQRAWKLKEEKGLSKEETARKDR